MGLQTSEPAAAWRPSRRQVRWGVVALVACLLLAAVGYAGWQSVIGPRETYYLDVARPVAPGATDKALLDAAHDACDWLGDQDASVSRPAGWQTDPSFDAFGDDDPLVRAERAYLVHSPLRVPDRTDGGGDSDARIVVRSGWYQLCRRESVHRFGDPQD